jgi:hypothetical protein
MKRETATKRRRTKMTDTRLVETICVTCGRTTTVAEPEEHAFPHCSTVCMRRAATRHPDRETFGLHCPPETTIGDDVAVGTGETRKGTPMVAVFIGQPDGGQAARAVLTQDEAMQLSVALVHAATNLRADGDG